MYRRHNYLCHHCLRYRCLFLIGTRNIIKTTFDSITTFYVCYFDCQSSPPPLCFIQLPAWRWKNRYHSYLCYHYQYLFTVLFDCGYVFRSGPLILSEYFYLYHFECQYSPSSTIFHSSSFVKIQTTAIAIIKLV